MTDASTAPITLQTVKTPSASVAEKYSTQLKAGTGGSQDRMKALRDYIEEQCFHSRKAWLHYVTSLVGLSFSHNAATWTCQTLSHSQVQCLSTCLDSGALPDDILIMWVEDKSDDTSPIVTIKAQVATEQTKVNCVHEFVYCTITLRVFPMALWNMKAAQSRLWISVLEMYCSGMYGQNKQ